MATTIKKIASTAGVSAATLSRVLNHKAKECKIASEAERLVLEAGRVLNHHPNKLARGFHLKKTNSIGLMIPDTFNLFFSNITR